MPNYEAMYQIMSRAAAQAMQLLADAHWKCEELYLSQDGEKTGDEAPDSKPRQEGEP